MGAEIVVREARYFWAVCDGRVTYAKGFLCNPERIMWWFPALGYTLSVGHHIFDDRDDAYDQAVIEAIQAKQRATELLTRLENERATPAA